MGNLAGKSERCDVNRVCLPTEVADEPGTTMSLCNICNNMDTTEIISITQRYYNNEVLFCFFSFSQLNTLQTVNVTKVLACNLDTFGKSLFTLSHPYTWVVELSQSMSA